LAYRKSKLIGESGVFVAVLVVMMMAFVTVMAFMTFVRGRSRLGRRKRQPASAGGQGENQRHDDFL
jgi:hypothetical protein